MSPQLAFLYTQLLRLERSFLPSHPPDSVSSTPEYTAASPLASYSHFVYQDQARIALELVAILAGVKNAAVIFWPILARNIAHKTIDFQAIPDLLDLYLQKVILPVKELCGNQPQFADGVRLLDSLVFELIAHPLVDMKQVIGQTRSGVDVIHPRSIMQGRICVYSRLTSNVDLVKTTFFPSTANSLKHALVVSHGQVFPCCYHPSLLFQQALSIPVPHPVSHSAIQVAYIDVDNETEETPTMVSYFAENDIMEEVRKDFEQWKAALAGVINLRLQIGHIELDG